MANEIYHANPVQVRQQIKAHLDEADALIVTNANDITALEAADVVLDGRLDILEGFRPSMMQFDGASYYTSDFTSSGNKVTATIQFQILPFTGNTEKRLMVVVGALGHSRISMQAFSSDYATTANRNRVNFYSENSSNVSVCNLLSTDTLVDGEKHTVFFSFDGDIGSATLVIDGDNAAFSTTVSPTTGTLDSGAGSIIVGAFFGNLEILVGSIGFFGHREAYLTNWTDFITAAGNAINIDTVAWTEWGAQPEYFNPHGQMTNNLGSEADMTQVGTVLISNPGYESAEGVNDPGLISLQNQVNILNGYRPAMMQYDGSTGYYSGAYTSAGNKVTAIFTFRADSSTSVKVLFHTAGPAGHSRLFAMLRASNDATVARRDKLLVLASNSAGTNILNIVTSTSYADGEWHSAFIEYDADAGTAQMVIDGVSDINTGAAAHLVTGSATMNTGASSNITVGSQNGGSNKTLGNIGFVGYRETSGLTYSGFFNTDGLPQEIDESGWTEWGAQPLFWNPHGQMTYNLGSGGNLTKNGTIRLWLEGFGGNAGLVI